MRPVLRGVVAHLIVPRLDQVINVRKRPHLRDPEINGFAPIVAVTAPHFYNLPIMVVAL
jgi:hypothetical protein